MKLVKSIEDIKEGDIVLIKREVTEWLINFHNKYKLPYPQEWTKVIIDKRGEFPESDNFLIERIKNKKVKFV
jgi:hypothetical protein